MSHIIRFADISDSQAREKWAIDNCKTFIYRIITDVSDVSSSTDSVYEFHFGDEKDAMWFRLNWE